MTSRRLGFAAVALFAAVACRRPGPPAQAPEATCAGLYRQTVACEGEPAGTRTGFVQRCEDTRGSAEADALVACGAVAECAAFRACVAAARSRQVEQAREARWRDHLERVRALVTAGRHVEAMKECALWREVASEGFRALCDRVSAAGLAPLERRLEAQRDARDGADWYVHCAELREMAARSPDPAAAERADRLCREVAVAERVGGAVAAARKAVTERASRLPVECEWVRADLAALDTPWARVEAAVVQAECFEALPRAAMAPLVAELTALRDRGSSEGAFQRCFDLRALARPLSAEAAASADRLCREVDVAAEVEAAAAEARAAEALADPVVPFQCEWVEKKVSELEPVFAAKLLGRLAEACWVALGRVVLARRVPGARACDFEAAKVVSAVRRLGLSDRELDPWVAKAAALCQ